MKLKISYIEILVLLALFVTAFYLWTLPFQQNQLPFGEGDAAWHFGLGDYIYQSDKTVTKLPDFIHLWYYKVYSIPGQLHYPPPYHIDYAIMEYLTNNRIVSVYIFIAITSFLGVFSAFLLLKSLYGLLPATIAGLGLVFSSREIMSYLWGQRPTIAAFAYTPIILFCFYKYLESLKQQYSTHSMMGGQSGICCAQKPPNRGILSVKNRINAESGLHIMPPTCDGRFLTEKPDFKYLIFGVLFISVQFLFHIQGSMVSIPALFLFIILWMFKEKKNPILKTELKNITVALIIFFILCAPFFYIYIGASKAQLGENGVKDISRLFSWFRVNEETEGYPASWFDYSEVYNPFNLLFLFFGLVVLLIRRKAKDLLLLSWLIAIYIALHLDVIGLTSVGREARMMIGEAPVFYSIIAVGLTELVYFFKTSKRSKAFLKILASVVFVVFLLAYNAKDTYPLLKNAYSGLARITPNQYEFTEWALANLPEDAVMFDYGTISYSKKRFIHVLSNRFLVNQESDVDFIRNKGLTNFNYNYVIIDYSDLAYLGKMDDISKLEAIEKSDLGNATKVYDKGNIKVYEVG